MQFLEINTKDLIWQISINKIFFKYLEIIKVSLIDHSIYIMGHIVKLSQWLVDLFYLIIIMIILIIAYND